jgi:hypothetical protein
MRHDKETKTDVGKISFNVNIFSLSDLCAAVFALVGRQLHID